MIGTCDFCGDEFPMEELTEVEGDNFCQKCQPDPEDEAEEEICSNCNGSGEGQHEGTVCHVCHGRGTING